MITLNGAAEITVDYGTAFSDPGASANDNLDGSVSVTIGGDTVNTTAPGSYTLTYDATDSSGNAATQVSRTVTVLSVFKTWTAAKGLSLGATTPSPTILTLTAKPTS